MAGNRRVATLKKKKKKVSDYPCCLPKSFSKPAYHFSRVLARMKTSLIMICTTKAAGGTENLQLRNIETQRLEMYLVLHTMILPVVTVSFSQAY